MRYLLTLATVLLIGCSKKQKTEDKPFDAVKFEVVEDKKQLAEYYSLPHIKGWYINRVLPPKFDYNMDLDSKSYIDLLLLRNEIYARNGYLFMDASLRGYFNQFKWYQPIWDVPDFKVQLDKEESQFVARILELEHEKFGDHYINSEGFKLINPDFVFNRIQFKEINPSLLDHLRKMNFALAPADREQLFYIYDQNQYQWIPNFITTDLYLQLLHKYMSSLLQEVEEIYMVDLTSRLTNGLYEFSKKEAKSAKDQQLREAALFANTYYGLAYSLISGEQVEVDPSTKEVYENELSKIQTASGMGSVLLNQQLLDYAQYEPVGNYTKDDTLKRYFRSMKWLNTAGLTVSDDVQLRAAALTGLWLISNSNLEQDFNRFNTAIGTFAGNEDGASISSIVTILRKLSISTGKELTNENLARIRAELKNVPERRVKAKGTSQEASKELNKPVILFSAARYTFDAEILIRLVHLLNPKPLRPFPKGLDVFAAMGNAEAEKILLNEFQEQKAWPAYKDTLEALKTKLSARGDWNQSIYDKTFQTVNSINTPDDSHPLFMKTSFWHRKNLITTLAAWTELKHDLTLYNEHSYAAEAGEGGGPPPPIHLSYVEPNIAFWNHAIQLIDYEMNVLKAGGMLSEYMEKLGNDIREQGKLLAGVSEKELKHEPLTNKEFDELTWFGGRIEYLTFRTLHSSGPLPQRERKIALVADVYSFNQAVLEEGVGLGDEIYVVAEINGYPYITKGSCFGYYEFVNEGRLTDEEWQERIAQHKTPERPMWLKALYADTPSLESKPGYSF